MGVTAFGQNRLYDEQGAVDLGNAAKRTGCEGVAGEMCIRDRPSMGTFIISAMFTAFATIMLTSSCGLATTTMPSTGRLWNLSLIHI